MEPGKGVQQKVGVVVTEGQSEAFHYGKYDMEGVKYIYTCNERGETLKITFSEILKEKVIHGQCPFEKIYLSLQTVG